MSRFFIHKTVDIYDPRPEITQWCEKHLVIPNPEYAKKVRMHLWLGNTPKTIALYEKIGDMLRLPYGTLNSLPFSFDNDKIQFGFGAIEYFDDNANIPLYDYQEDAVRFCATYQRGILQAPAGSGKTQMGLALLSKSRRKALWLTHTVDLLQQSLNRAEIFFDPDELGTITGGQVNIGKRITFATVQTMSKLDLSQYTDEWDFIIVDECHRCTGTPTAVTMFSKVLNSLAARYKIGLSATVHRSDGLIQATYALLGPVIYEVPREAVQDRVMQVTVIPVWTGEPITDECLNTDGTVNYSALITNLCSRQSRNALIQRILVEERDHPSLILSDRLSHLEELISWLPPKMREKAVLISGQMTSKRDKEARHQAMEDMRNGTKKYLFATYSLAKEGLDIPCLETLFLTTPHKDYAVITQAIGRISRVSPGKDKPFCFDFVDDMPMLIKAWRRRVTSYKKAGCKISILEAGK